jgi:hypothetical protein
MISRWLQNKDLLEAYSGKNTKRIITTRLYPKLEDQLYTWIINCRIKKASINWSDIRNQTKKLFNVQKIQLNMLILKFAIVGKENFWTVMTFQQEALLTKHKKIIKQKNIKLK